MIDAKEIELDENYLIKESYGFVQPWFPKLIYFKDDLHIDKLDEWSEKIRDDLTNNKTTYTSELSVKSNHGHSDMLTDPTFDPLWKTVLDHSHWFTAMMGYVDFELTLVNAWANISLKNDYLYPHVHPGSLISGAFYVKSSPTDHILFQDSESVLMRPSMPNDLTYDKVTYECKAGRLLLFKSDTLHGVTRQEAEDEKIVISFNLIGKYNK